MKTDEPTVGRRVLLRGAVFLGVAAAAGLAVQGESGTPGGTGGGSGTTGTGAAGAGAAGPAAGAPGRAGLPPNTMTDYRLRPLTGEPPARAAKPARAPVRTRPVESLPHTAAVGAGVVLTFDDGPDPRYTPAILDTLARYRSHAMFFVCGEMAVEHPDLLKRMVAEGHVIGNHTWSHPLIPKLSRPALAREMSHTSEVVDKAVGAPPQWFRAPYGAWNRAAFELGSELDMEPLAWTVDTLDWKEPGTGTIVSRVLGGVGPGVIVLNHDAGGDRSQSVRALESYLPAVLARGYRTVLPDRTTPLPV
ncbi:polysaccharide deacetylase family protein [Streptomyces sp. BI20]|uniref:polysaccharide deacetylase family protein n=1 Tax=Streptomyces sp. BI20 TaxID=3403460 RepID=UPI003C75E8CD